MAFAIFTNVAKAQTDLTADTSALNQPINLVNAQKQNETMRAEMKVKMDALKDSIKNEKDKTKAKIKEAIITGRENALGRFDTVIEKTNSLKDRINDQISKLKTRGIDVGDAENLMATVETKLTEAQTKIVEVNTLFSDSIDVLSAEDKTNLKTLTEDIQNLLNDAHDALNNTVKSLKDTIKTKI